MGLAPGISWNACRDSLNGLGNAFSTTCRAGKTRCDGILTLKKLPPRNEPRGNLQMYNCALSAQRPQHFCRNELIACFVQMNTIGGKDSCVPVVQVCFSQIVLEALA